MSKNKNNRRVKKEHKSKLSKQKKAVHKILNKVPLIDSKESKKEGRKKVLNTYKHSLFHISARLRLCFQYTLIYGH